jgi:dephospho-CoA kinase
MLTIGLTGGVASGKSKVSEYLLTLGAATISADIIGAEVLTRPHVISAIKSRFGSEAIVNGAVDKEFLRQEIFTNPDKRAELEALLHPLIRTEIKDQASKSQSDVVVVEVPLLIEAGWQDEFDQIWLISVAPDKQIERLMARDNIAFELARKMQISQLPDDVKKQHADIVIENNGSLSELKGKIAEHFSRIISEG